MKASSGQESRPTRSSGVSLERRVNYSRRHGRVRWYLRRRLGSENARLQELEPDRTAYVIDLNAGTLIQLAPLDARATHW